MNNLIEKERRFLIDVTKFFDQCDTSNRKIIDQVSMLVKETGATMRVRIINENECIVTVKSIDPNGTVYEHEHQAPIEFGQHFLRYSGLLPLTKTRYIVPVIGTNLFWEVDIFLSRLHGLYIAEIELPIENIPNFNLPEWIITEITGDHRLSNTVMQNTSTEEIFKIVSEYMKKYYEV